MWEYKQVEAFERDWLGYDSDLYTFRWCYIFFIHISSAAMVDDASHDSVTAVKIREEHHGYISHKYSLAVQEQDATLCTGCIDMSTT